MELTFKSVKEYRDYKKKIKNRKIKSHKDSERLERRYAVMGIEESYQTACAMVNLKKECDCVSSPWCTPDATPNWNGKFDVNA